MHSCVRKLNRITGSQAGWSTVCLRDQRQKIHNGCLHPGHLKDPVAAELSKMEVSE